MIKQIKLNTGIELTGEVLGSAYNHIWVRTPDRKFHTLSSDDVKEVSDVQVYTLRVTLTRTLIQHLVTLGAEHLAVKLTLNEKWNNRELLELQSALQNPLPGISDTNELEDLFYEIADLVKV